MQNRQAVLGYAKRRYGTDPEYLWKNFPDYAVLRHKNSGKWYGICMNVARAKLNLAGAGKTDILNIKAGAELAELLRGQAGILPAYHMNKRAWLSLLLDGAIPDAEIFSLLDKSYELAG